MTLHSVWNALQPYIGELLAAMIIAFAAKLHLDWSKYQTKIKEILDAIISEVADVENQKTPKPLSGWEKKAAVSNRVLQKFADKGCPWWSEKKLKTVIKTFGSVPAAVEKAFTIWNAAKGIKNLIK